MKISKLFLAAVVGLLSLTSCGNKAVETKNEAPTFWTWAGYNEKTNWDSTFVEMKRVGFEGMLLSASIDGYKKVIPIAKKHGITLHAWVWSLNDASLVETHPEWYSVNRLGESLIDKKAYVDYYKFLCPIIPGVREHVKDKFRKLCELEGLDGISLDYHRFVDVILPTTLWANYGIVQDKEYAEWDYGYHPEMIKAFKAEYGYDPREQEDPSQDDKWLQFRCDQVSTLANEIGEIAHQYGKDFSASPFPTPEMSRRMVRQDWGSWKLDKVFPMIYHGFYTNEFSFIEDCVKEDVKEKYAGSELYCGLYVPDFRGGEQPIDEAIKLALKSGAKGIALFQFSHLTAEQKEAIKAVADSLKK